MIKLPEPAKRPTMYFVGVTTGQSSIMKMFPIWAKELGLDAEIKGIDLPIHAPAEDYRAVVQFFRDDPLSLGALLTTHKIDMYNAAKDMFDYLDPALRGAVLHLQAGRPAPRPRQGPHLLRPGPGRLRARGPLA